MIVIAYYQDRPAYRFEVDPDLDLEPQLLIYLARDILIARQLYMFTTTEGDVLWKKYQSDPDMPWEPFRPRRLPTWSPPEEISPFSEEEPGS